MTGPDLRDDGPNQQFRRGGGIAGPSGVFYWWLFVAAVALFVTLVGLF